MPELSSEREVLPSCIWTRPISRTCSECTGVLGMHWRTRNVRRKYLEAAFFQNSLSISILYSHNALWSMFLWRLRSIRLQKKRLSMDLQWHFFKTHCSKVASRRSRRSVKLTTAKNHSKHCSRRPSCAGGKMAADYKSAATLEISCNVEAAPPEGHIIHESLFSPARDAYGCKRQKAPNYIFG